MDKLYLKVMEADVRVVSNILNFLYIKNVNYDKMIKTDWVK